MVMRQNQIPDCLAGKLFFDFGQRQHRVAAINDSGASSTRMNF